MAKRGRPKGGKNWAKDWKDQLCARVSSGRAIRNVIKDKDMPSRDTVYRQLAEDAIFSEHYAQACNDRADAIFEDCLDIADQVVGDHKIIDGKVIVDHDAIARARLRIDTRKWMAGKLRPKKYGDKIDVTSGGDKIEASSIDASKLSPEAMREILKAHDDSAAG